MKTKYFLLIGVLGLLAYFLGKRFLFGGKAKGKRSIFKPMKEIKTTVPEPPTHFFKIETTGNIDKDIQTFVKAKEGGLSRDPNDTPPANDPAPGTNGAHTNIGITWGTYKNWCKKKKREPRVEEWLQMKPEIWGSVFMDMFAGKFVGATDSKLINYQLGLWAWGSPASADSLVKRLGGLEGINKLITDEGAPETFARLIMERDAYYDRLIKAKPEKGIYRKGWKNANFSFYKNFAQYA